MMEDGLILEYDIIEAKMKKNSKKQRLRQKPKPSGIPSANYIPNFRMLLKVADLLDLPVDTVEESLN